MRNLWLLLQRNAFLLAFLFLMGISLSVLFRNDGSARSTWFKVTGGVAAGVEAQQQQWSNYLELAEQNAILARENAELKSELLSMSMDANWAMDSTSGWSALAGLLVQGPNGTPRSMSVGEPGGLSGLTIGAGVLSQGAAYGTVVDVGEHHVRILPLLNTAGTWSCRLGRNGPVSPMTWDGKSPTALQLKDVPRYAEASAGDTVYTSGFDLHFPDGVPVGIVEETITSSGSDFKTVLVRPALTFSSVRHLQYLQHSLQAEREALARPLEGP